jgi:NADH:ubiquinone oxidoreductase subunit 5 (subunit L)/multisubunit Na+/H+ antiporter MnhA subunit
MADDVPKVPFGRRFRRGMRTHRAAISVVVLAAGLFLSILALGFFTPLSSSPVFAAINSVTNQTTANYNLVFVILGPIVAIIGAYLVGAYYYARRKFEHLMVTKSKAEFLRNIPELEEILWDLTPIDEVRYENKRAELRVRR